MKLYALKTKAIVALVLVLCLVMPFISPAASAYVMTTHTHSCHDKEHGDSCAGTKECCKICLGIYRVKTQSLYYYDGNRVFATSLAGPPLLTANDDTEDTCRVSLTSLKVRLNN